MPFKNKIKILRNESGLSQEQLAKILNFSRTTISAYESGRNEPSYEVLKVISDYFDVSVDYLLDKSDVRRPELPEVAEQTGDCVKLPVLNKITNTKSLYEKNNISGYKYTEKDILSNGEYFFLNVNDDSMDLYKFTEGDIILIRRQEQVDDGSIAVIQAGNDNAVIRKIYTENNIVNLIPCSSNSIYKPITVDTKKTRFRIIGKAVQAIINIE
jgi:SOS-response transcriptional repressor LexA